MTKEKSVCPICGQGIYCGEVEDNSDGYVSRIFSCGCKCDKITISTKITVSADIPQMISGAGPIVKVRKNGQEVHEYEIKDKFMTNDLDQQGRPTNERYYRIKDHSIYHAVKYSDSPKFKHIDCKKCGNDWKCQSGLPIENYFSVEHNPEASYLESFRIRCLKCNCCWSWKDQKNRLDSPSTLT